jgi:hypothetical protein
LLEINPQNELSCGLQLREEKKVAKIKITTKKIGLENAQQIRDLFSLLGHCRKQQVEVTLVRGQIESHAFHVECIFTKQEYDSPGRRIFVAAVKDYLKLLTKNLPGKVVSICPPKEK